MRSYGSLTGNAASYSGNTGNSGSYGGTSGSYSGNSGSYGSNSGHKDCFNTKIITKTVILLILIIIALRKMNKTIIVAKFMTS